MHDQTPPSTRDLTRQSTEQVCSDCDGTGDAGSYYAPEPCGSCEMSGRVFSSFTCENCGMTLTERHDILTCESGRVPCWAADPQVERMAAAIGYRKNFTPGTWSSDTDALLRSEAEVRRLHEGKSVRSVSGQNEERRAARPVDHGHERDHAPFFDGLVADCEGCRRLNAPASTLSRTAEGQQ